MVLPPPSPSLLLIAQRLPFSLAPSLAAVCLVCFSSTNHSYSVNQKKEKVFIVFFTKVSFLWDGEINLLTEAQTNSPP